MSNIHYGKYFLKEEGNCKNPRDRIFNRCLRVTLWKRVEGKNNEENKVHAKVVFLSS